MSHSLWPDSPPGSSVHGISKARILEWVAISFSRGFSQYRDQTWVSCIGKWILYHWASRESPTCISVNWLIDTMWYIHKVEYYSVLKGNEILANALTWMNLENMLSERSQVYMMPFIWNSKIGKSIETESKLVIASGWEKWKVTVNRYRIYFADDENILELMVMIVKLYEHIKTQNYIL